MVDAGRLAALIAEHGVPGASVSVLADGRITDTVAGVASLAAETPVRVETPFMIQSTTKVLTATLVMQLVDDGLVSLDAPVTTYLPGFRSGDDRVSVRHLLTHTGGFEGDIWAPTTDDTLEQFVDEHVASATQLAEPGAFFSYCSAGMAVLGRIVEVARGLPFSEALHRHLLDPLGVTPVVDGPASAATHGAAIGHVSPAPGAALRPLRTWAVMPASNPAAGNRLALPAHGLAAVARLHLDPTRTGLLSGSSARLMREPQVPLLPATRPDAHQGLGWRLTTSPYVVEHGGDAPGNSCLLRLLPERGLALAVLANGGDAGGLFTALSDEVLGPSPRPVVPPLAPVTDPHRYVGRYELRNVVHEVTADAGGHLRMTTTERADAVMMAELAGEPLEPRTVELHRLNGEVFRGVSPEGSLAGAVEFIGSDDDGRAEYAHTGRAAPRV